MTQLSDTLRCKNIKQNSKLETSGYYTVVVLSLAVLRPNKTYHNRQLHCDLIDQDSGKSNTNLKLQYQQFRAQLTTHRLIVNKTPIPQDWFGFLQTIHQDRLSFTPELMTVKHKTAVLLLILDP